MGWKLDKRATDGTKAVLMLVTDERYTVILVDANHDILKGKYSVDHDTADMYFNKTAFELNIGETRDER